MTLIINGMKGVCRYPIDRSLIDCHTIGHSIGYLNEWIGLLLPSTKPLDQPLVRFITHFTRLITFLIMCSSSQLIETFAGKRIKVCDKNERTNERKNENGNCSCMFGAIRRTQLWDQFSASINELILMLICSYGQCVGCNFHCLQSVVNFLVGRSFTFGPVEYLSFSCARNNDGRSRVLYHHRERL